MKLHRAKDALSSYDGILAFPRPFFIYGTRTYNVPGLKYVSAIWKGGLYVHSYIYRSYIVGLLTYLRANVISSYTYLPSLFAPLLATTRRCGAVHLFFSSRLSVSSQSEEDEP
jgi:hypothetical protein